MADAQAYAVLCCVALCCVALGCSKVKQMVTYTRVVNMAISVGMAAAAALKLAGDDITRGVLAIYTMYVFLRWEFSSSCPLHPDDRAMFALCARRTACSPASSAATRRT